MFVCVFFSYEIKPSQGESKTSKSVIENSGLEPESPGDFLLLPLAIGSSWRDQEPLMSLLCNGII